jgi:hypothetical protein
MTKLSAVVALIFRFVFLYLQTDALCLLCFFCLPTEALSETNQQHRVGNNYFKAAFQEAGHAAAAFKAYGVSA